MIKYVYYVKNTGIYILGDYMKNKSKDVNDKIKALQDHLNNLLESKDPLSTEVLKLSKDLDLLIIEYYETNAKK